jgi:hypothetical protein
MLPNQNRIRFALIISVLASLSLLAAAWGATCLNSAELLSLLQVLGNMHPLLLHLPIGVFIYIFFAEGVNLGLATVGSTRRIGGLTPAVSFGTLSAFAAAALGLLLYMQGGYAAELATLHLRWGIAFAISTSVVWVLSLDPSARALYRLVLFVCVVLMALAGHYGALITHGDPLAPWRQQVASANDSAPQAELRLYEDVITSILQDKCYRCHASDSKQKGGLAVDSYPALLAGGKQGDTLVPGSLEDSLLSLYIHLPADHDQHMPPQGQAQLAPEEIKLIDHWIAADAQQSLPVAEAALPLALRDWVLSDRSEEPRTSTESKQDANDTTGGDELSKDAKNGVDDLAEKIQAVEDALVNSITRYNPQGDALAFTAVNAQAHFDDGALKHLEPVFVFLVDVDLSKTKVTSRGVQKLLANTPRLQRLNLSSTQIDETALTTVPASLESLVLYGTQITKAAIDVLSQHSQLKSLFLGNTSLSSISITQIQAALPQTEVVGNLGPAPKD